MLCNKIVEQTDKGYVLRVRLQPSSSSCSVKGVLSMPDGDFLKISVCSVPEKGKANKELLEFLAKKLKLAKSKMEIISGELDKYKKVLLKTDDAAIIAAINELSGENDERTDY